MDELKTISVLKPYCKFWELHGVCISRPRNPRLSTAASQSFSLTPVSQHGFSANIPPALVQKDVYLPSAYVCMFI